MEKKLLYTKKFVHTSAAYFSTQSLAELRHLSYQGISFLHACVKEVFRLWAKPRSTIVHQLITVEALWSQPNLQVGKQMGGAWSEIRAVRRVVKQLPVETLQQCSSASSCVRTRIAMKERYTVCRQSTTSVLNGPTHFLVFRNTLLTLLCPLLHEFHHQNSSPVPENSSH
jgi:hypothetical protein